MKFWLLLAGLLALGNPALADGMSQADAGAWLQRVATAAHRLNYSGTFLYQQGGQMQASRISHMVDDSGEHERIETLDGEAREVVRHNDRIVCILPDQQPLVIDNRSLSKPFPALLPVHLAGVKENYLVRRLGSERVAGHECQVLLLEPRDRMRYSHKLWADKQSGLLLRAATLNEKGEVVEQFAFTQISSNVPLDRDSLRASRMDEYAGHPPLAASADNPPSEWQARQLPAGFRKIGEMRRTMPGKNVPVQQVVYSDGLAAISVFVEARARGDKPMQGLSNRGALNVFVRATAEHQITVLGEVPAATLTLVGNSVGRSGK